MHSTAEIIIKCPLSATKLLLTAWRPLSKHRFHQSLRSLQHTNYWYIKLIILIKLNCGNDFHVHNLHYYICSLIILHRYGHILLSHSNYA